MRETTPAPVAPDDRRGAPRLAMDADVTLTGDGGRSPARCVNASERVVVSTGGTPSTGGQIGQ